MKYTPAVIGVAFVGGSLAGLWASQFIFSSDSADSPVVEEVVVAEDALGDLPVESTGGASDVALAEGVAKRLSFAERVEQATSFDSYRRRQYEMELLFEDLTADEAEGVLADILEVKEPRLRGSLMRPFFVKWGELDGALAYATASELSGRDRNDGVSAALAGWSHTDVHAAWEVALPIIENSSSRFSRNARGVVAEMAKQDPDVLLKLLAEDSSKQKYSSFGYSLINQAFENDQQTQLLAKLDVIENGEDRGKLVGQLFQRWGALDTEAPLDALGKIEDPEEAKNALEGFLRGWVESDREGALNYAFENQQDPAVQATFGSMLQRTLREGSRSENEELVSRLESQGLLGDLAPKLSRQLSFMQPEMGIRIAEAIEDPKERTKQLQMSLSGLARTDLDKARDYIESVESLEEKADFIPSVSSALASRSDGGAQLVLIMEGMPAGKERVKVIESLLRNASRSPERLSNGYKEGLTVLATSETELSKRAKEALAKISVAGQ